MRRICAALLLVLVGCGTPGEFKKHREAYTAYHVGDEFAVRQPLVIISYDYLLIPRGTRDFVSSMRMPEEGTRAFGFADDVPAAVKQRRRNALMARQKRIVADAQKARVGTEVAVLIDGPSPEHELVLQGRLEGQAPDIDPVVFLTGCDPENHVPGELIRARIVSAKGYDLIAAPQAAKAHGIFMGGRFE